MAKKLPVSTHLPGIATGKTYSLNEVRKCFSRATGILENGAFERFCALNSECVLIIKTPFMDYYTFTGAFSVDISALGIEGERVKPAVRSTEAPQSQTEGNAQIKSLSQKYKPVKND